MTAPNTPELPRIIVGVDGSDSSIEALRWAARLGPALGAEIDAVASWEYPMSYGMVALPVEWVPADDAAQGLANTLKSAFSDEPPDGIRSRVLQGNPAAVLVDASVGARMLIVGSRGHGGFVGPLIGSVSTACIEHAPCPVLVTRSGP